MQKVQTNSDAVMKPDTVMNPDIVIIGAGPSGAVAAALLVNRGYKVTVFERQTFPRFSIGESLLPQCMEILQEANLLNAVKAAGFQFKNGAAFHCDGRYSDFNFEQKFTPGFGTTFQVQRATFDKVLADEAERLGANILYQHEIVAMTPSDKGINTLQVKGPDGKVSNVEATFVLDASGFGRVLPRLLDLEYPSHFPQRTSLFTHIEDNIADANYDRNKILVCVHPKMPDVWYWLIPFSNGRCSVGVVAESSFFERMPGDEKDQLKQMLRQEPRLKRLLQHAVFDTQVNKIVGYACNVKSLHGPGFALLGNAGEFLDPVFSSGVTIALKSAQLAVKALDRQLQGQLVDWQTEYAVPLQKGVGTFRHFVEAWYDGRLHHIIFAQNPSREVRAMISSILAGYAWDQKNPYVSQTQRRLNVLSEFCRRDNDDLSGLQLNATP